MKFGKLNAFSIGDMAQMRLIDKVKSNQDKENGVLQKKECKIAQKKICEKLRLQKVNHKSEGPCH